MLTTGVCQHTSTYPHISPPFVAGYEGGTSAEAPPPVESSLESLPTSFAPVALGIPLADARSFPAGGRGGFGYQLISIVPYCPVRSGHDVVPGNRRAAPSTQL